MLEPNTNTLQVSSVQSSSLAHAKPNKGLLIVITMICFALLTILMIFSGNQSALALDENKLLLTQQAKVEAGTIRIQKSYLKPRMVYGQIASVQQSDIGFELNGTLDQTSVLEGAMVRKGQVLAKLDTGRLEARKNELQSALVSAKANAKLAKLSAQRVRQLVQKKVEPQQRLDEVQAQLDAAQAASSEVQARLNSLQVELEKSVLLAPFDGQIVAKYIDSGTVVSPATPVFSIIAKELLEARFGLPEQTAFGLSVGESRELHIQGQPFSAEVTSVAKQRNQATRTIDTLFSIDINALNEQQRAVIVSGDLVSLTVDIPVQSTGAWVPISALASGVRGLWTLYIIGADNTIQTRLVSVEYADAHKAFVSGAIKDGDRLVVSGIHRLVPHQSVKNIIDVNLELAFARSEKAAKI